MAHQRSLVGLEPDLRRLVFFRFRFFALPCGHEHHHL